MSFQIESPHAVRKLSGGKTPDLPVDLYLPDFKGVILMIEWILYFYTSASGLPIIIKNIYSEQFALAVRTNCFKFPSHMMPRNLTHLPTKQQFYSCCKSSIKESKCLSHDSQ